MAEPETGAAEGGFRVSFVYRVAASASATAEAIVGECQAWDDVVSRVNDRHIEYRNGRRSGTYRLIPLGPHVTAVRWTEDLGHAVPAEMRATMRRRLRAAGAAQMVDVTVAARAIEVDRDSPDRGRRGAAQDRRGPAVEL